MIKSCVVAASVLAGLAVPAFAAPSFPVSFTTAVTNASPPPGVTLIPTGVSSELNAIDAVVTGYSFALATNPQALALQYTISFVGSTVAVGGDLHVFIYNWAIGGGTPTTTLTSIKWAHGANTAEWSSLGLGFANGDTKQVYGANDLSNYTTFVGTFDRTLADTLVLTFSVVTSASGDFFVFDAVSNPEPGTMALFGLGAMGLGGLVWRRRRANNAPKAA